MNAYGKQAADFAAAYGVKMYLKRLGSGYHFPDDKKRNETRDIYIVKLVRGKETYVFRFGQSMVKSLCSGGSGEPPALYDILASLTKYDPGTFADFRAAYGYIRPSPGALRTYTAVKDECSHVQRLFGDVLDELCEIQ